MSKSLEDLEYRQSVLLYLIKSSMSELDEVERMIKRKVKRELKNLQK